ncbi:MBL fold metallo-hydrolase [Paraliomyxa miuraensis]|uniref:MBL fold metallo-hydrolase n=1 Tax=Paraliomyxa miuraensis TaxID=376150 RepID=UPI00225ADF99|nr:MBL fold metallo-hydrolase [Paraliomyxa miuraensis]MCX4247774.1 MBL fold metallo-hydrolase [Paraliomyxa miuraensis]
MIIDLTHLTTGEAVTSHNRRRLDRCLADELDPRRISRWLEASVAEAGQQALLTPGDFLRGGFLLPREHQLHEYLPEPAWSLNLAGHGGRLTSENAAIVLQVLANGVRGAEEELFDLFAGGSTPRTHALAADLGRTVLRSKGVLLPGIYRWIHATLLVVSATTVVVLDPIAFSHLLPEDAPVLVHDADGVVITHTHRDHWHPPGLAPFLGDQTALIVPRVPRLNILSRACPAEELQQLRIPHLVLDWGETAVVGDIELEALPFFGEQPVVEGAPLWFPVRNWGNCYRVTTPEFSVLILVDSGKDPAGDMVDVLEEDRRRNGPADLALACMREFPAPFFGGLPSEWLSLPLSVLQKRFEEYARGAGGSSTAGVSGLARACAAAGVRSFAPYAHGYEGVARAITDIGWGDGEQSEQSRCRTLFEGARALGHDLRLLEWNVGDGLYFDGEGWAREPLALLHTVA